MERIVECALCGNFSMKREQSSWQSPKKFFVLFKKFVEAFMVCLCIFMSDVKQSSISAYTLSRKQASGSEFRPVVYQRRKILPTQLVSTTIRLFSVWVAAVQ